MDIVAGTADGVELALTRVAAAGERRAICLFTHAMMASSRYLISGAGGSGGGIAGYLAGCGIEVYTLDFRGHGRSRPRLSAAQAEWCFDDFVFRDLPAAVARVCEHAAILPGELVYAGHSLGGLAGLAAVGTGAISAPRAMGLWASSVWLPGACGSRRRRALMQLYALSARPRGYAPIRLLRMGSDNEPRGYVEQMAWWARTGRWQSRGGVDYLAALAHVRVPVWSARGDGDRLCSALDIEVLLARLTGALPLRRVGCAQGDARDADHFSLLTAPELAPVWGEFAGFAAATAAQRGGLVPPGSAG